WKLVATDDEIEVGMSPRLAAQQRVDAPTSVQPHDQSTALKLAHNLDHTRAGHTAERSPSTNRGGTIVRRGIGSLRWGASPRSRPSDSCFVQPPWMMRR